MEASAGHQVECTTGGVPGLLDLTPDLLLLVASFCGLSAPVLAQACRATCHVWHGVKALAPLLLRVLADTQGAAAMLAAAKGDQDADVFTSAEADNAVADGDDAHADDLDGEHDGVDSEELDDGSSTSAGTSDSGQPAAALAQWTELERGLIRVLPDPVATRTLLAAGADVHIGGEQPLLTACVRGYEAAVRTLLAHGADLRKKGIAAVQRAASFDYANIVEVLLESGAAVSPSVFGLAATNDSLSAVKVLLTHPGASKHAHKEHMLQAAIWRGHLGMAKMVLEHGVDVHASQGLPLRIAARYGRVDIAALLLQRGADVHAARDGALRLAARWGHAEVVALLLQHGADVHRKKDDALREAVRWGHREVVELLLQHGADPRVNAGGVLHLAMQHGHYNMLGLLIGAYGPGGRLSSLFNTCLQALFGVRGR